MASAPRSRRRPCAPSRRPAASSTWERADAGAGAVDKHSDPLPQATIDSIKKNQLALKGPLATPSGGGYRSVNVDAAPAVRPLRERAPGADDRRRAVALHERRPRDRAREHRGPLRGRRALRRSAAHRGRVDRDHHAVRQRARDRRTRSSTRAGTGRKKVTLVHKANILKMSNGLFLDVGREIAKRYPDIEFDDMIVDATAMKLVIAPERFDVIVTMNLFGDILSDLTAGPRRRARRRAGGEHRRRRLRDLRGGARHGARHRGQGHREPDRASCCRRRCCSITSAARRGGAPAHGHPRRARERRDAHRRPRRQGEHGAVHRRR